MERRFAGHDEVEKGPEAEDITCFGGNVTPLRYARIFPLEYWETKAPGGETPGKIAEAQVQGVVQDNRAALRRRE